MIYRVNELEIDLPVSGFEDRTVHELVAPLADGSTLTVLVVREKLAPGVSLADAARVQERREAVRLFGHRTLGRRDTFVNGAPAIDVAARWMHDARELQTRTVHFQVNDRRMALAATAPAEFRELVDACVDRALATLQIDDGRQR